jgi:hypothetical protein
MQVLCEGNWRKDNETEGKVLSIRLDDWDDLGRNDADLIERIEAQAEFYGMSVERFTEELITRAVKSFTLALTTTRELGR